jgi:uncharacterized protein (TIGR00251 family)
MLGLRNTSSGIELDVHVQPGARRSAIAGTHAERLKIAIQAPPVDGKANDAVIRFFAQILRVPRSAVAITRGEKSRDKTVAVEGLTAEQAAELLEAAPDSKNQKAKVVCQS